MAAGTLRPARAPLLELPAAHEILRLDGNVRSGLQSLLLELRLRSREDGDGAWRKRKGPMATYRHDIARHAALLVRALRRQGNPCRRPPDRMERTAAQAEAHKPRSSRASVRNPLLRLETTLVLRRLPAQTRGKLRDLLRTLARACAGRADGCWSRRRREDALYWRTAAVYAGHLARALAAVPYEQCELPLPGLAAPSPDLLVQPCEEKPSPSGSSTRCSRPASGSAPPPRAARSIPESTSLRAA